MNFHVLDPSMEPNSPSRDKHSKARSLPPCRVRIAKLCVVVVTVITLLLVGAYHVLYKSDRVLGRPYFSVVVDCGSTGTRVNVYEWEMRAGTQLPVLLHSYPVNSTQGWKSGCRYHCMQTEPGLDKFVGNSSGIRASLEPLIRWAEGVLPTHRRCETSILVLATAGLRSLPSRDAERVLDDVELVIKDHGFVYRRSWIRVLSGKEEAYFGWVALNYKMGILGNTSQPVTTTLGLLDLGGSSLQVVMEVDEPEREDDRILSSDIAGKRNELLAVSIPEFGLNEAFDRSVAMLSAADKGQGFGGEVRHPCLGSAFVQNYTCSNCLEQRNNPLENWFGMVGNTLSRLVYVVGDPDMELCVRLVKAAALNISISDWSKTTTFSSCRGLSSRDGMTALGILIKSNPDMRFHALSGFFVVYNMLDLPVGASTTEIWTRAQKLCSQIWSGAKTISNRQHPSPQYCFKVLYMVSLITDALCLGDSEIVFGPGDLSWTLGASLVQQEQSLNTSSTETLTAMLSIKYQQVVFFPPLTLFLVLLLALYVVYTYQVKLPMPRRRSVAPAAVFPSYNHFIHRPS